MAEGTVHFCLLMLNFHIILYTLLLKIDTIRRLLVVVCDLNPIWWGQQVANIQEHSEKVKIPV